MTWYGKEGGSIIKQYNGDKRITYYEHLHPIQLNAMSIANNGRYNALSKM